MIEGADPEGTALADLIQPVAVAVDLLRRVDQAEIDGEGADDLRQGLGIQGLDALQEPVELGGVRLLPQGGETLPQTFHHHQHPLGAVLAQDLTEESGEEINIATQLVVGSGAVHWGDSKPTGRAALLRNSHRPPGTVVR